MTSYKSSCVHACIDCCNAATTEIRCTQTDKQANRLTAITLSRMCTEG